MINLQDLTFTIPIRIDSQERVRNLITTIKYLNKHFDTNIIVYEESPEPTVDKIISDNNLNCVYKHIKSDNTIFHRTKLLNLMAKESKTPYIANYDADVLLKIFQYEKSLELLRSNECEMIYPYNGHFVNISDKILENVITNLTVESLQESDGHLIHCYSVGGVIMWNKSKFMQIGMENENFVSWGFEDNCRLERSSKLGVKIFRLDSCLFHMLHPTGPNSSNVHDKSYADNGREYSKIRSMSQAELLQYIKTWSWCDNLENQ